jgi:uncharacterized peroxidase-related enzyme
VAEVLADYRTAPIPEPLRAILALLEKLTLTPRDVGPDDVAPLRALGLTDQAIEDAVHVTANFAVINRLADAFGFEVGSPKALTRYAGFLLQRGYLPPF